jgi:hypothetical protein
MVLNELYAVHVVRAGEIPATMLISGRQETAERHAQVLSTDPGVLAGAVTQFVLDVPGRRTAVALYVAGERQQAPYVSDNRRIYANGHEPGRRPRADP